MVSRGVDAATGATLAPVPGVSNAKKYKQHIGNNTVTQEIPKAYPGPNHLWHAHISPNDPSSCRVKTLQREPRILKRKLQRPGHSDSAMLMTHVAAL